MNIEELGKPWTILQFNQDEKSFKDDSDILKKLFLHDKVKDRKVVVFSIVGSFRRGKSFFLDYCLRYLYANYDSLNRKDTKFEKDFDWMGHKDDKLSGFSWRSGAERDTTGIVFWSDVFFHTNDLNEKFAIFVVDTQGLFDNETTLMENSQIFALSSLISSIQVINLNGNIREDELDYFQFAMEFSKLAKKDGNESKEFQKLVFLVRDWQNADDYDFGKIGGAKYLNHVLKLKENKNEELNSVREFISKSCEKLSCHLLPHPGKGVAGRKGYNGQWSLMDEDFRFELFDSIESLLNSENLVEKKICGRQLSAENFFVHLQTYFKHFASSGIPKVTTMYKLLVEKDLEFLVSKAFNIYKEKLADFANKAGSEDQIDVFFKSSKELVISNFKNEQKIGDAKIIEIGENKLNEKISTHFNKWKATQLKFMNDEKTIQKLKTEAELLSKTLENEQTKNKIKHKQVLELLKISKSLKENLETEKASYKATLANEKSKYEATLQSEKSKYESTLTETRKQHLELQDKINEMNSSIKQLNSQISSHSLRSGSSIDFSDWASQLMKSHSYTSSVSSVSSNSGRCANPWNQFQREFSPIWRAMSAEEKLAAGGHFQTACSRAYWASKE